MYQLNTYFSRKLLLGILHQNDFGNFLKCWPLDFAPGLLNQFPRWRLKSLHFSKHSPRIVAYTNVWNLLSNHCENVRHMWLYILWLTLRHASPNGVLLLVVASVCSVTSLDCTCLVLQHEGDWRRENLKFPPAWKFSNFYVLGDIFKIWTVPKVLPGL